MAEEISPRIEVSKAPTSIDKEIVMLEKQIEQSQNLLEIIYFEAKFYFRVKFEFTFRHGNEQEITKQYMERKNSHKKITEDIKKNQKFLKASFRS